MLLTFGVRLEIHDTQGERWTDINTLAVSSLCLSNNERCDWNKFSRKWSNKLLLLLIVVWCLSQIGKNLSALSGIIIIIIIVVVVVAVVVVVFVEL